MTLVRVLALTLPLALLMVVPTAAAAPLCTEEMPDHAGVGWYATVRQGAVEVWHETNEVPGLQTTSCRDAEGTIHGADFRNVRMGAPTLPCIPVGQACPF